MVVLDEKAAAMHPPPAYVPTRGSVSSRGIAPPPFPGHLPPRVRPTLATLPPHLLLNVVYATFPIGQPVEKQRQTLYWLSTCLRMVNRTLYIACMNVLRSTYLPAYTSLVRQPFSTDPFPFSSVDSMPSSASESSSSRITIQSIHRETAILDLFLTVKVREDVYADESEFHLEREESFRDIFDLMQPRARLEDLVRMYGIRERVISAPPGLDPSVSTSVHNKGKLAEPISAAIPFGLLSVSFSSRRVGLILTSNGTRRTIVEVQRERMDTLETSARRLVRSFKSWLTDG